ncbi:MAG: SDR family oxidoreductase [Planctomycetia bacterium]|nr:SDR family oxidoreductase [Planctomycetia bacterium]
MTHSSEKSILLTGGTGLIGRYLIKDLLLAGKQLCVLARPSKKQSAEKRIDDIIKLWEKQLHCTLPRPHVVSGEVTETGLGLSSESRKWVAEHCDRVMHNAAVLEFHGSDREGEPWRTNLRGTENMLKFCRNVGLRDWHYVSTAYVSGNRTGRIFEHELNCGQGFRNDYEESKLLSETAVRNADFLDQLTIYRPAVVAGDSVTAYTSTYHGIYLYLRIIALVVQDKEPDADGVRRFSLRWNCTGNELRNIVPVDWVSAAMTRLFLNPAAHGGTYHLAPQKPTKLRELVDYVSSYYNTAGVEYCGKAPEDMSDFERESYAQVAIYEPYLTSDPTFDITNLLKFTADMPSPAIDEAMIHRFIQFGENDKWGKRRGAPILAVPYPSVNLAAAGMPTTNSSAR